MATVALQGFHAVKHALRFGAHVRDLMTTDAAAIDALRRELAPDVDLEAAGLQEVDEATWDAVVGARLPSPLHALAERPAHDLDDVVDRPGPLVLLEQPRHLGNLGAVVRVAAAAGAAGVLTTGDADPWHPMVVRAAAGLHFAVPVLGTTLPDAVAAARAGGRELVAIDGGGTPLRAAPPAEHVLLLFGTERHGLSTDAHAAADRAVAIEMVAGVSSLNLATAAAVVLYAGPRIGSGRATQDMT